MNSSATRDGALRVGAVVVGAVGFFMVLLDGSALNVALPDLERSLDVSLTEAQWVVTVYTLPLASLLLTAGAIADGVGTRTLYVTSLAGFTISSGICALSPNLAVLVVGRILQGCFAAGILPTTLTITAAAYDSAMERAKAITVWGAAGGIAMAAGPLGGGALTEWFGWRAIFLINLPIGVLVAVAAWRWLPDGKNGSGAAWTTDLRGQGLGLAALLCLTAALIESGTAGWGSPMTILLVAIAALAGAAFVWRERTARQPLIPPVMFRSRPFTAAVAGGFAFQFGAYGLQFVLALFLQQLWQLPPIRTGMVFVPFAICWALGNVVLNRRLLHLGPRVLIGVGSAVAAAGTVTLLGLGLHPQLPALIVATAVIGGGCGLFAPSLNTVAVTASDPARTGLASGILNTSRQAGMSVAIALLGALLASPPSVAGLHHSLMVIAASFIAVTVLTLAWIPGSSIDRPVKAGSSDLSGSSQVECNQSTSAHDDQRA